MRWLCRAWSYRASHWPCILGACHYCRAFPCKFTGCIDLTAINHRKSSLTTVGRTAEGTRRLPPRCWSFAPVMHLATTIRCSGAARAAPLWAAMRSRSLAAATAAAAAAAESSPSSGSSSDAASGTRVALVQGSSRGLGLEFVRQLVERPNTRVVATCRSPAAAEQLQALQQRHAGRLHIVQLDSTDESSIARAAEQARRGGSLRCGGCTTLHCQEPCGLCRWPLLGNAVPSTCTVPAFPLDPLSPDPTMPPPCMPIRLLR